MKKRNEGGNASIGAPNTTNTTDPNRPQKKSRKEKNSASKINKNKSILSGTDTEFHKELKDSLDSDCPAWNVDIMMRCLELDPAKRPDMASDSHSFSNGTRTNAFYATTTKEITITTN